VERSTKTLLAIIGSVAIFAVVAVLAVRVFSWISFPAQARPATQFRVVSPNIVTRTLSFTGFTSIAGNGAWEITIHQGAVSSVTVSFPESLSNLVAVTQEGDTLTFSLQGDAPPFSGRLRADVTMDTLKRIDLSGAGSVSFSGFTGRELLVRCSGAASVEGTKSRFDTISVATSGAADILLREAPAREARVDASGAGKITLNMTGGNLSGTATGVVSVQYWGSAAAESVRTSGAAQVIHRSGT
jgi:Putative auto-transporter adhesin, head GIN domain